MAVTKIRGNTQIMDGTIENDQISATAAIATTKLADGADFVKKDGSITFTADQSMGNFKLTNLAAPTGDNDAARKIDVDQATKGLDVKLSCRAATTADLDLSTDLEAGDVIDGVTLVAGNRVLVKAQTDASQNGIYVASASGAAVRADDFDDDAEVTSGAFTFIEEGTICAQCGFVVSSADPITVGTHDINWTQFSGSGAGDVNNATNVGTAGVGVFKQLNGDTLEFYKLNGADAGKISVALDGANNEIDLAIVAGSLVDADLSASANVARTKLASGSANHVLINDGSGVMSSEAQLSLARGGTGSDLSSANGDRIMVSNAAGTALVELAAITANRALVSGADGLPVASSVTDTELGYVSGVTSAIQTQLDAKIAEADFVVREVPSGTINGINDTFTLASTPVAGTEQVFLNGILQDAGASDDYTIAGGTITMASAPETGDKILVSYLK